MVTAPVQKSTINDAGIAFSGHTNTSRRRAACRAGDVAGRGKLRVALEPLTCRWPSAASLTRESSPGARRSHQGLSSAFRLERPRILVCGLNPHAGESGHLGREEIDVIGPRLPTRARAASRDGPVPADTAFAPAMLATADAVLAMYHDQGLPVVNHASFGAPST